jgi:hypothetical protein
MNHSNAVVHNLGRVVFYCDLVGFNHHFVHKQAENGTNRCRVVAVDDHAPDCVRSLGNVVLIDVQLGIRLRFQVEKGVWKVADFEFNGGFAFGSTGSLLQGLYADLLKPVQDIGFKGELSNE